MLVKQRTLLLSRESLSTVLSELQTRRENGVISLKGVSRWATSEEKEEIYKTIKINVLIPEDVWELREDNAVNVHWLFREYCQLRL